MPSTTPRSVQEIVEHQVQTWLTEQKRRARERVVPEPPRPVITISRQAGTDGTELGRRVADGLGFRLWDQELVQRIAEQTGASEKLTRALDEHARGAIEDLLAGILMGEASTENEYVAQLIRLFHAIAYQGSAVIVGRGAQFVLSSDSALHLRLVGDSEVRLRHFAATRQLSESSARVELERIDRERTRFIRHHYHRDPADPCVYDLVLNMGALPLVGATAIALAAYRAKFPRASDRA